jgi:hypothetical protein
VAILVTVDNPDDQLFQSLQLFESLPLKAQRIWVEEFREPQENRVFIVCAWWGTESGVFSQGEGLCFQAKSAFRTCSRMLYTQNGDDIQFIDNAILTDNDEESWVDEAGDDLMELAKQPGLESQT